MLETLEEPCARIVAREHASWLKEVAQDGDDFRLQAIHRLRQRLHDKVVAVFVDHQRGEKVGFAVHEPIRGRVDAKRVAERDGGLESAPEPALVESIADVDYSNRDLRSIAVERPAKDAAARALDGRDVTAVQAGIDDIAAIDPRMAAAQAFFAACGNDDDWSHRIRGVQRARPRASQRIVKSRVVRIAIGADHAGFALKEHLKQTLARLGHAVADHGTTSDASIDYPPICFAVGREVAEGRADRGIVLGGSGQGEQIAANKIPGVRAALCNDLYTARLSRQHNDANVLSMGGRIVATGLADEILELWLTTAFEGGRHQRRIDQISAIERRGRGASEGFSRAR